MMVRMKYWWTRRLGLPAEIRSSERTCSSTRHLTDHSDSLVDQLQYSGRMISDCGEVSQPTIQPMERLFRQTFVVTVPWIVQ